MVTIDAVHIAAMLDDEDENVAVNLLAQLLARADELGDIPALLQESPSPLVRRRAHQLQSALNMRNRRERFHQYLLTGTVDLVSALEDLHMLWFDKDSAAALHREVVNFCSEFRNAAPCSLEEVEFFMRKCSFLPEAESTISPENYCIGAVLDRHCGAASLLMALAVELAGNVTWKLVRVMEEFGIYDGNGTLLLGNGSWRLCHAPEGTAMEFWDFRMILRFIANTLLSCAVNSDSYRYVMSLSQAISGDRSEHVFDTFPYPFRAAENDNENS